MKIFQFLRDWSEVWALLIPLIIILVYKPRGHHLGWVVCYVVAAFILNFLATFIIECYDLVPIWLYKKGNNVFYNLHSFVMTLFFCFYFISVRRYKKTILLKTLLILYIVFVLINFVFLEPPTKLSTRHFTTGSIVLLIMCLFYFIHSISEESQTNWLKHPSFIICSAVFLYESVTFFIYLFFYPMYSKTYNKDFSFALLMMRIYQAIFIVFCILLAIGLYRSKKIQSLERTD
jgi:hypothetical protein